MSVITKLIAPETLGGENTLGSIMLFDCTGVYSASNLGGWGTPNEETTDVTKTEYIFTDPDGTVTTIEDTELVLPNTTSLGFKITADQLGLEEITSGVWDIEYRLTTATGLICSKNSYLMKEVVQCCQQNEIVKIVPKSPLSAVDEKTVEDRNLLCAAIIAADIGLYTKADDIMSYLRTQCECC